MIKAGRVAVNDKIVTHPGRQVDPRRARISVDGKPVRRPHAPTYIVMNKPVGIVTTRSDPRHRRTVMDLLEPHLRRRVYPVGRLDRDATGLLLLTNDGDLTNRLLHPSRHVPRAYEVEVEGQPSTEALTTLAAGVEIDGEMTARARVKVHRLGLERSILKVTLREGRKNQLKRMCAAVGHPVISLRRVSFGSLHLGDMPPGASRRLREGEVHALKEAVGLADPPSDREPRTKRR